MSRLNVNPTRMQLKILKQRLITATRGHKMLKDKTDEMIRRFTELVKKNYTLRQAFEEKMQNIIEDFVLSKSYMSEIEVVSQNLLQNNDFNLKFSTDQLMNIIIPHIEYEGILDTSLPYSFVETASQFDLLVPKIKNIFPQLIELATLEKTCQILALEIEKNKRRVNALEFNMIPQIRETIKYIEGKIDENERASRVRILKVKSFLNDKENV